MSYNSKVWHYVENSENYKTITVTNLRNLNENMIKGLDDDEIDFLELVDRSKMEEERKKCAEEEREMADFRNKVATLQEKSLEQRIQQEVRCPPPLKNNNIKTGRTSQTKLLAGVVVKKRPLVNNDKESGVKRSRSESEGEKEKTPAQKENEIDVSKTENSDNKVDNKISEAIVAQSTTSPVVGTNSSQKVDIGEKTGGLTCIGILPGLGPYSVSSDESDCSTDIEEDAGPARYDLLGRRIKKKTANKDK
ncbi:hypothetical protein O3M35_012138 [Rhynocoris fuscipes]|uniref:FAM192A/Fyv6 N-terminal domain-containing protein n=1 Tax=Rhynocoris fuscipes TaxID=488301 RepID=A0AAW1CTU3_9HEMI